MLPGRSVIRSPRLLPSAQSSALAVPPPVPVPTWWVRSDRACAVRVSGPLRESELMGESKLGGTPPLPASGEREQTRRARLSGKGFNRRLHAGGIADRNRND